MHLFRYALLALLLQSMLFASANRDKTLAYIVSDLSIPFWEIMARGIKKEASKYGYSVTLYSADNSKKNELQNTIQAIASKVDGVIISPINSSSAATILHLAHDANIPVVIADIGANRGEYVSYISSDNYQGAYDIGKVLAAKMQSLGWDKEGAVGIIAIPQKRANGKARTAGFLKAMDEAGIKGAGIKQQVTFSKEETYHFAKELIETNPNLKALWLQGSDKYEGALEAIEESGREILLLCFDAEPIFLELIPKNILVGAAMQQPYLMGQKAVDMMHRHFNNQKVTKEIQLNVLAISKENIQSMLPIIKRNVLGIEEK
ncbi:MAG: substrate-binding domain-containing protein [Campylobacterales bacterium]|nr:substrate-binding domain-containing protein [Campylobacterales bacterium]